MPRFPFLTLLISGGHTLLLLARSRTSFQILASTHDESIGRAFDDVSRMLNLQWSENGLGAALEQFCASPTDTTSMVEQIPKFPAVLRGKLEFSYAALHAHVERFMRSTTQPVDEPTKLALARAFQTAAIAQLEEKLTLALRFCRQKDITVGDVIVSGGVASNMFLRERSGVLQQIRLPGLTYQILTCTDCEPVWITTVEKESPSNYYSLQPLFAQVNVFSPIRQFHQLILIRRYR